MWHCLRGLPADEVWLGRVGRGGSPFALFERYRNPGLRWRFWPSLRLLLLTAPAARPAPKAGRAHLRLRLRWAGPPLFLCALGPHPQRLPCLAFARRGVSNVGGSPGLCAGAPHLAPVAARSARRGGGSICFHVGTVGSSAGLQACPCVWRKMVGMAGFEPATPRPPVWCASQAALHPDISGELSSS